MRVTIALTVDVDPAEWDLEYGTGTEPAVIRDDVRRHALNAVQQGMPVRSATLKNGT